MENKNESKMDLLNLIMNVLSSSENLESLLNQNDQYYTQENVDIVHSYLKTFIKSDEILEELTKIVINHWVQTGQFYTLEELVNISMTDYKCHCPERTMGIDYKEELCRDFMKFFIVEFGDFPRCPDSKFSFEYYQQEHKFPLPNQLQEYMTNYVSMMRDPLNYRCEKKSRPTENLDKMKSFKYCDIERKLYRLNSLPFEGKIVKDKKIKNIILNKCRKDREDCSLCFNQFKDEDQCFMLKCSHIFHAEESEDCGGLRKWLKDADNCPVCRMKVKV
jgi:hypothetical protein